MEKTPKPRIKYIDSLKGFAIICVVLGHVIDGYLSINVWPSLNGTMNIVFNIIYAFHMPLLFVISGYLFELSYVDNDNKVKKNKLNKHIIDYIWLYILFCILLWISKLIMGDVVNNTVQIYDILMIWAIPMPTYWYLYVLVAFYIIFSIITNDYESSYDRRITFLLITSCLLSNLISGRVWFQIHRILYYAIFFWIGIEELKFSRLTQMKGSLVLINSGFAILLMASFWNQGNLFNSIPIVNVLIAYGLVTLICYVFANFSKFNWGGAEVFGRYSLEIYLMHCFVAAAVRVILNKLGMINLPILCLAITFALSISIPILIAIVIKKVGLYNIIFKPYETITNKSLNRRI